MKRDYICEVPSGALTLTFDDGSNPFFTPQILDVLAEHRVPATFFIIRTYAAGRPEFIRLFRALG